MTHACKRIGAALALLGVGAAFVFVLTIVRDDGYRSAASAAARNPGNIIYETELGVAKVRRAFELVGVVVGVLLAINGMTLLGLGVVAGRVGHM